MRKAMAFSLMALFLGGCGTTGGLSSVSDDDLAQYVKIGAEHASRYGLKLALDKDPAKADAIAKNATLAVEIIRKNVLPVFSGAGTADVLRSAVETALGQLSEKLGPQVVLVVQLAMSVVSSQVTLPTNPADKLDARAKMALAGFFDGAAAGLEKAVAAVSTRDIGPPRLVWPAK